MSDDKKDDKKKVEDEDSKKSGMSPLQVAAAGLAAVTAAFLCSTLGVYGTVLGAGLLSVVTTLGSELYMRSLERTKEAARKLSAARPRRKGAGSDPMTDPDKTVYLAVPTSEQLTEYAAAMERTRVLSSSGAAEDARERRQWWRRRGPVLAATSALGFLLCMLVVTGYEGVTGKALSGEGTTTVGSIVRGGAGVGGDPQPQESDTDVEQETDGETTPAPTATQDGESWPGGDTDGTRPTTEVQPVPPETSKPVQPTRPTQPTQPTQPGENTTVPDEPTQEPQPTQPGDGSGGSGGSNEQAPSVSENY
ncbi:hypothetical protein [Saccharomonospora sp.]|uniref:hypothetical protein n=1 Tax=Saccharomonospora sp. TaxID=33913 RepID=UPI00262EF59F|nr:hypothetical protein [Saccharomonospora sp.]